MASNLRSELSRARHWHALLAFLQQNGIELAIFVGIVASAVAASADALHWPGEPWATITAALPGAVLLIERQFRYRLRSSWHEDYRARLRALERKLRDQASNERDVSDELSKLDLEMRSKYPKPA
jgi:hypothetical protein